MTLPHQKLQAVVFGFSKKDYTDNVIVYNHLFVILKLHVYHSREKQFLSVGGEADDENKKQNKNSLYSEKKHAKYNKKVQNRSRTFCLPFLS